MLKELFRTIFKTVPARGGLGEQGENVAARHLRSLGYRIIARNYRTAGGEIDIIARDGKTLVFVEVKTRAYDDPTPEEQVSRQKEHQITKAAKVYLARFGQSVPPARFDIVAIVWPSGQRPIVRHTPDAFEASF